MRLTPAAVQSAGITIETVTSAALTASSLTGAVEPNQQQLQQVTALTNGRIELASPTGFEPVLPP